MTTCISRRAFGDHLRFRLINDKGEDGRWIWMEYRCPNEVCNDGEVCRDCSYKIPGHKYQANHKFNHGKIGGPYTIDSKLYGSPYYLAELKKGWKATEQDEIRAKAALLKANSEMGRKKEQPVSVQQPVVEQPVVEQPVVEQSVVEQPVERKKRAYNRKKVVLAVASAEQPASEAQVAAKVKPVKLKTHRSKKILPTEVLFPPIKLVENPLEPKFIEVVAPPITITDFVVVKIKKLKCQGKDYYYDEASGKVYSISVNGVGAYKGRYNQEDDIINTSFPDSDCE